MKKEIFDHIRNESKYIALIFLLVFIAFKIAFFNENLIVVIRNVLSLFWLFVLPGYFMMLYWKEHLEFMERFVIGIALSAGIIGVFSYYVGIIGLNIKYHSILLPTIIIIIGLVINNNRKN